MCKPLNKRKMITPFIVEGRQLPATKALQVLHTKSKQKLIRKSSSSHDRSMDQWTRLCRTTPKSELEFPRIEWCSDEELDLSDMDEERLMHSLRQCLNHRTGSYSSKQGLLRSIAIAKDLCFLSEESMPKPNLVIVTTNLS
jgi:hypothetical protein